MISRKCSRSYVEPAKKERHLMEIKKDCVHPCALLIVAMYPHCGHTKFVMETLAGYGWLDVMGRADIDRAKREITRVQNLKGGK
ncbi:hypothetical protein N9045_00990 [bacterium]|nr:hypothetical protein [bacterium]